MLNVYIRIVWHIESIFRITTLPPPPPPSLVSGWSLTFCAEVIQFLEVRIRVNGIKDTNLQPNCYMEYISNYNVATLSFTRILSIPLA